MNNAFLKFCIKYNILISLQEIETLQEIGREKKNNLEELYTQNKLMRNLARRTQQIRANTKLKKIEIENKHIKVDDCKKRINDLSLTLEEIQSQKLNVEERTKRLEKMIEVYLYYIFMFYIFFYITITIKNDSV
ncbi:hypothetical protein PUN28_003775 [Cardiocondyla obscurior]|uniref:Uncharacterized protein n=1 Tax=Cardiocondyla obscurior TaxID=286306 RepID=A0AAW2GP08_9HYME